MHKSLLHVPRINGSSLETSESITLHNIQVMSLGQYQGMNCYQAYSSSVSGEVPCYVKNEDTGTYLPVKSTLTEVISIFYILNSSSYAVYDMVFFSEIAPTGKDGESLLFSLTRTDNGKFGFFYPTTYANRFQTRPDYIYDPSILLLNADDEGKDVVMNYEN